MVLPGSVLYLSVRSSPNHPVRPGCPCVFSAQGYDAIKVLGHAIEKGGTSKPIVISINLKFLKNWHGVTGSYSFTQRGDIIDI
jgi:ABC-type branched-subunit amino acid transport system substrate-binding protein